MKKIVILLLSFALIGTSTIAQDNLKPYLGAGVSLSSNTLSKGAELGVYNDKAWFAVGAYTFEDHQGKSQWFVQYKNYVKVLKAGKVDNFLYYAVNVDVNNNHAVSFEPGIATVFNVMGRFAPQLSISFPTGENQTAWNPLPMSFGLGLNWWIK